LLALLAFTAFEVEHITPKVGSLQIWILIGSNIDGNIQALAFHHFWVSYCLHPLCSHDDIIGLDGERAQPRLAADAAPHTDG
jgi:hypothetical protein